MFQSLHTKLDSAFKLLRGRGSLSQKDIDEVLKKVRMALLEADVNFQVAKDFCARIAEKATAELLSKSLTPDQQVIKIVNEELTATLGGETSELNIKVAPPAVIMVVGLQGSGKTTTCSKLALLLKKEFKRTPLLVPADVYRAAAITQLKTLGAQYGIEVFDSQSTDDPVDIAKRAVEYAKGKALDTVIIDTAGRLQIDNELMNELIDIAESVNPNEVLLVADAMTGQEAVNIAKGFDSQLDIDGIILTKLDGDARGGAALSMRTITGKPIKFIGVGEKADAFEVFHPERMASRILDMGDVLSLIEKASKNITLEDTLSLQDKFKKNEFTLEDFLGQMKMINKMGSITSLAGMLPGMNKMMDKVDPDDMNREMKRVEAIILSMTPKERKNHAMINGSRRKRIAKGSGTRVEDVNRLLKQFTEMKTVMSKMMKGGLMGMLKKSGIFGGGMPGMK